MKGEDLEEKHIKVMKVEGGDQQNKNSRAKRTSRKLLLTKEKEKKKLGMKVRI